MIVDKVLSELKLKVFKFFGKKSNNKVSVNIIQVSEDYTQLYRDFIAVAITKQAGVVGVKPFDPNYHFNFLNCLVAFDIVIYVIINAYDIKLFWGPLQQVCYCIITWIFGFTGAMLLYTLMFKQPLMCMLVQRLYGFSDSFDRENDREEIEVYKKYGKLLNKLAPYTIGFNRFCGFVATFYPIVIYLYSGKVILPYGFVIPGISYTENPGYAINYAFQSIEAYLTTTTLMEASVQICLLFIFCAFFQIDLIIIKIRKFNILLQDETTEDKTRKRLDKLVEIIKLHQNYQEYLQTLEEFYSNLSFVNLCCYTFHNVITLFVLVNQFWIVGYLLVLVLLTLIFIPCACGTLLEMKNDRLINEVYGIDWYLLNIDQRKMFAFLLHGTQNVNLLSFGGYFPMNFETFKNTYSKVYSYLMFLIDVQK